MRRNILHTWNSTKAVISSSRFRRSSASIFVRPPRCYLSSLCEKSRSPNAYEKDGYSWMDNETLDQIIKPERMAQIKLDFIATLQKKLNGKNKSNKLVDILADENEVCANCFI